MKQSPKAVKAARSLPIKGKKDIPPKRKGGLDDTQKSKTRGGYGAARPNFGKTAKRSPIPRVG